MNSDASNQPQPRPGIKTYARMVRLEHALFSLPLFASGALLVGQESFPGWLDWVYIIIGGTAARNLALAGDQDA